MKKTTTGLMLFCFVFSSLFSCKHEIPPVLPGGTEDICFENNVLPIFQSNCAKSGCHDAASREEGYQLDNYENIVSRGINPGNASNSEIYEVLKEDNPSKIMPPPDSNPLTEEQKNLIAKWINEGARNTTNCAAACDSSDFTYSKGVAGILRTHCLGCHSGGASEGGYVPLDSYDAVKQQVDFNTLYPSITHTGTYQMPKNGAKLNDCKIAIIRKWIAAGAPDN